MDWICLPQERSKLWTLENNAINFVGFDVLTAVVMKSFNFWNITPCSPSTDVSEEHVTSIFRFRISHQAYHVLSRWFLARLLLRP
jgi:hypothetical protein